MNKNETPNERFVRIAEARTQKIIEMIRLLGNCSNTYVYEFSKKDVSKIFDAIDAELLKARKKFGSDDGHGNDKFTLR